MNTPSTNLGDAKHGLGDSKPAALGEVNAENPEKTSGLGKVKSVETENPCWTKITPETTTTTKTKSHVRASPLGSTRTRAGLGVREAERTVADLAVETAK